MPFSACFFSDKFATINSSSCRKQTIQPKKFAINVFFSEFFDLTVKSKWDYRRMWRLLQCIHLRRYTWKSRTCWRMRHSHRSHFHCLRRCIRSHLIQIYKKVDEKDEIQMISIMKVMAIFVKIKFLKKLKFFLNVSLGWSYLPLTNSSMDQIYYLHVGNDFFYTLVFWSKSYFTYYCVSCRKTWFHTRAFLDEPVNIFPFRRDFWRTEKCTRAETYFKKQ